MLDPEAVPIARNELVELLRYAVVGLEVVREGLAVQFACREVAHLFQHRVRSQDPAFEIERHHADRRRIEDRPELSLARSERVLRALALGDVDHHSLPVGEAGRLVLDDGRLLGHPDHVAVTGDHPVLGDERRQGAARARVLVDHPVSVVRVQDLQPELVVGQPRLARIPHQALDLRAYVQRERVAGVIPTDEVHVHHDPGDPLDEPLEPPRQIHQGEARRAVGVLGMSHPRRAKKEGTTSRSPIIGSGAKRH